MPSGAAALKRGRLRSQCTRAGRDLARLLPVLDKAAAMADRGQRGDLAFKVRTAAAVLAHVAQELNPKVSITPPHLPVSGEGTR